MSHFMIRPANDLSYIETNNGFFCCNQQEGALTVGVTATKRLNAPLADCKSDQEQNKTRGKKGKLFVIYFFSQWGAYTLIKIVVFAECYNFVALLTLNVSLTRPLLSSGI